MAEEKKCMNENQDVYYQKHTKNQKHTKTWGMDDVGQALINGVKIFTRVPVTLVRARYDGVSFNDLKNSVRNDCLNIPSDSKIILFVGETGAGKTSTINTIGNVLANVKYYDSIRIRLVDESKMKKKGSASQTQNVQMIPTMGYTYTLIDTPGINDTNGKGQDKITIKKIRQLLTKYLSHIDAICFVVKYTDNRATPVMNDVMETVLGFFAKDIINNAYIIAAHCNSGEPEPPKIIQDHETLKTIDDDHIFYVNNEPFMIKGIYL